MGAVVGLGMVSARPKKPATPPDQDAPSVRTRPKDSALREALARVESSIDPRDYEYVESLCAQIERRCGEYRPRVAAESLVRLRRARSSFAKRLKTLDATRAVVFESDSDELFGVVDNMMFNAFMDHHSRA